MHTAAHRQIASQVDPASIAERRAISQGAELLVRRRPPGSVNFLHGQREHMLLCSVGRRFEDERVVSMLRTGAGQREWTSCPRGHVSFVPAAFPLEWDWSYESESIHLTMLPESLEEVGRHFVHESGRPPQLKPLFRVFDNHLAALLRQLRDEQNDSGIGADLVSSSLLQLISARLYRLSDAQPCESRVIFESDDSPEMALQRCIEMLNDRLDEKFSLAELAKLCGLSPFHFTRVFKNVTGFPPHEYQLQLRIAHACEMLRGGDRRTLAEMACDLGFSDESHFRRHFRRIVGLTPGRFRAQQ